MTSTTYTVNVQDFQGKWTVTTFNSKQEVFDYIVSLDMQNAVEIEGVEQTGDVIEFDELEAWLNS